MTAPFYDSQPDAVRAVIDLAGYRDGQQDTVHDLVLAAFAPEHADTLREIADALTWIERCEWDEPTAVLHAYYGTHTRAMFPDRAADELAACLKADVLLKAQLVASTRRVGAVA